MCAGKVLCTCWILMMDSTCCMSFNLFILRNTQVNTSVPQRLPLRDRNYTLAHQIAALVMHIEKL